MWLRGFLIILMISNAAALKWRREKPSDSAAAAATAERLGGRDHAQRTLWYGDMNGSGHLERPREAQRGKLAGRPFPSRSCDSWRSGRGLALCLLCPWHERAASGEQVHGEDVSASPHRSWGSRSRPTRRRRNRLLATKPARSHLPFMPAPPWASVFTGRATPRRGRCVPLLSSSTIPSRTPQRRRRRRRARPRWWTAEGAPQPLR